MIGIVIVTARGSDPARDAAIREAMGKPEQEAFYDPATQVRKLTFYFRCQQDADGARSLIRQRFPDVTV